MKYHIIFIFVALCYCCEKPDPIPPIDPCQNCPTNDTIKLDSTLEWQVPLHPDSANDFIRDGIKIYNGSVVYITNYYLPVRPIVCRDIKTGKERWRWIDPDGRFFGGGKNNTGLYNHTWTTTDYKQTIFLDVNTGTARYNENYTGDNAGWPRSRTINNNFYHIFTKSGTENDKYLVRMNIDMPGIWDTLFVAKAENKHVAFLEPPSAWTNLQGEPCLVFCIIYYKYSGNDARSKFIVLNEKTLKEEFSIDDYIDEGQNSVLPILIHNNKAYIQGQRSFHCIDLIARKEIWKRNFFNNGYNLSFSTCNAVIAEDKLITKSEQEDIRALDLNDGHTIWENLNVGSSPNYMEYHNGRVYFDSNGSGGLWGVRVSDGALKWKYKSPNKKINSNADFISGGVTIDNLNNRIITSDGFFLMSIKLPK